MFIYNKYLIALTCILYCCSNPTNSKIDTLNLSFIVKNVSEFGNSDGSINVTVEGGTKLYQYEWSNGATTEDISNFNDRDNLGLFQ